MRILDWDTFVREGKGGVPAPSLALSIGVFDGVHRGHQKLIEKIRNHAAKHGGLAGLVTFIQNPRRVLHPAGYPGDIYPLPQKLKTLEGLGVDFTVLIDFSGDISKMMGSEFVALMGLGRVSYMALGANFRCGYRLDTDGGAIRDMAAPFGTFTELVPQVRRGGAPVSSSRIRRELLAGNIAAAAALLGRPFTVDLEGLRPEETANGRCYDLGNAGRVLPPGGRYSGRIYPANSSKELETPVTLDSGRLFIPVPVNFNAVSVELCGSQ
ncbi:MAG: FAD synthetase family protein [Treponema sp.]|jgi:riboflavin kinase/FMN adenylyltransferase|nr:FAD synthetase family protein [Treponema sp.]